MPTRAFFLALGVCAVLCLAALTARATETEHLGLQVLPAPGAVTVDGNAADWDLSGAIFTCGDVEGQREQYAVWLSAMYDAKYLYVLARWADSTPMNNPGQTIADYGWDGDCLQVRLITNDGTPRKQVSVANCWKGSDGADVVQMDIEGQGHGPRGLDMKPQGVLQAFRANPDGKGYVQEIAFPWALLTADHQPLTAGGSFILTMEPNFTIGRKGRLSIKDIFRPGVTIDRVFTFMAANTWGVATLEKKGHVVPRPVRLSDAREFPVKYADGQPVIDWTGLIKQKTLLGFKPITFTMPDDGYVSLNLYDKDGTVVRQLLNSEFRTKGKQTVLWDGLTTTNFRTPGTPVAAGSYTWHAIVHKGIGVRLRGWAANSGSAPWDASATSNWGGDHGIPCACVADDERVYLGWSAAEAGKALLACDRQGHVLWKNSREGMAGAELLAADHGTLYVQHWGGCLYRLNTKDGSYLAWDGTTSADIFVKNLWGDAKGMPERADTMAVTNGTLYLGFTKENLILAVDGKSGAVRGKFACPAPVSLYATAGALYAVSGGTQVLRLDPRDGKTTPVLTDLTAAHALTRDAAGNFYVGIGDPDNQVKVYSPDGKLLKALGRPGGRALLGTWQPDGMRFISSLAIDADGQLWVAENDRVPKRFSTWNTTTGALVAEFFGPSSYGALGGAINPRDPYLMVGQGCEWRLDPKTGTARCLGVITRDGMENARFGIGANGRLYLAVAADWFNGPVAIYERLGDANYKLRTLLTPPKQGQQMITVWSDANDDGRQQPEEVKTYTLDLKGWLSGWFMPMTGDLTFWGTVYGIKVTGYTACGAPLYDLTQAVKLPEPANLAGRGGMGAQLGLGSTDGKFMLYNGHYMASNSDFVCYDIASGKVKWTYPNNFVGVHGSHNAGPPEPALIRGAYDIAGAAKLPVVGDVWVIGTNFGEWHLLTQDGFYLTRLFEPDPLKVKWPDPAVPGVDMNHVPSGMGGEDFGGSVTQGTDGTLSLQVGKTGYWNVEVTGLPEIQALKGGAVTIKPAEVVQAQGFREGYLQAAVGKQRLSVAHASPAFTGDPAADFKGCTPAAYRKQDDAAVKTMAAWDDTHLYLSWDVADATPWQNSATDPFQMYIGGDTVDLQLGTNAAADKNRGEGVLGDLRVSIGNFRGTPTAVLYRKVSAVKQPYTFSSGVIRAYPMDYVSLIDGALIHVKVQPGKGYVVEASLPLAALGFTPREGLTLHGDFGVTHGDAAGRTRLRTYWSNQHTGIVDDAVFELQVEPKNWGELEFKP